MSTDRPPLPEGFSWKRMLWKGIRPALLAGALAFGAAVANDVKAEDLEKVGVPATIGVLLIESGRNYFKNRNR